MPKTQMHENVDYQEAKYCAKILQKRQEAHQAGTSLQFPYHEVNRSISSPPRLDFRRSLMSGLPSLRRDGWTRERQTMSVT